MTQLDCTATQCRYNDNKLCVRAGITVEGADAHRSDETYCGNYEIGKDGCACNAAGASDGVTDIRCDATTCRYNERRACRAGSVDIVVCSEGSGQTACASFEIG